MNVYFFIFTLYLKEIITSGISQNLSELVNRVLQMFLLCDDFSPTQFSLCHNNTMQLVCSESNLLSEAECICAVCSTVYNVAHS